MADRSARRRAGVYRHRAAALAEMAKGARDESDRRHMLELAATHERTADSLAPVNYRRGFFRISRTPSSVISTPCFSKASSSGRGRGVALQPSLPRPPRLRV